PISPYSNENPTSCYRCPIPSLSLEILADTIVRCTSDGITCALAWTILVAAQYFGNPAALEQDRSPLIARDPIARCPAAVDD
ncbi:unnamed protein product, partial [Mycena citricolor]